MRNLLLISLLVLATTTQAGGNNGPANTVVHIDNEPDSIARSQSDSASSSHSVSGGGSVTVAPGGLQAGAKATSGGSTSTRGGASIAISEVRKDSSSSAAAVHAGYCQAGASGQMASGGFSVITGDAFCEKVRMADRALIAYQQMVTWCNEGKAACDPIKADSYLSMYHESLADADRLLQTTEATGWLGRVLSQLAPLGILALLIL